MLLFYFLSASPRNDGATIGRLGLAGAFDWSFVVGAVAFEAVRLHGRPGENSHCEAVASSYLLAMTSRRSNLLEKGNPS